MHKRDTHKARNFIVHLSLALFLLIGCAPQTNANTSSPTPTNMPSATMNAIPTKTATVVPTKEEISPQGVSVKYFGFTDDFAQEDLKALYEEWKQELLIREDDGTCKVVRPEFGNDVVSESMAYGMILSTLFDDDPTTECLWTFVKNHGKSNKLMPYHLAADDTVLDSNSASDADLDMLYALTIQSSEGKFKKDAAEFEEAVRTNVFDEQQILKPSDGWSGQYAMDYFSLGYFHVFGQYYGEPFWFDAYRINNEFLNTIYEKTGSDKLGLVPNWTLASGNPVPSREWFDFGYKYNAVRWPWRVYFDIITSGSDDPIQRITKFNNFFMSIGADNIVDGYTLDGQTVDPVTGQLIGEWHNSSFICAAMLGAIFSNDEAYRSDIFNECVETKGDNYFNKTLRAIDLKVATEGMPLP